MRIPLLLTLAVTSLASAEPRWRFKPGDTLVWECRSEYEFSSDRTNKDGETRRVDSPTVETLTLEAAVEAVGDDGSARLRFKAAAVSIDAVWHDTGRRARWDSRKDRDVIPGFDRYAAIVGHEFSALVGPDGAIRELEGDAWPKTSVWKQADHRSLGEDHAAETAHDPTPARAWLDLVFATTPREKREWSAELRFPDPEPYAFRADGKDRAEGHDCRLVKFDSPEKAINGADVPKEDRRAGRAWFSEKAGVTVKAELSGRQEAERYRPGRFGQIRWTVVFRERKTGR